MNKVFFSTELNERNIKLRDKIIKIAKDNNINNPSILEIGIGNGRGGVLLSDFSKEYCGIDIDEEYVKIAKEKSSGNLKIKYKVGNAINIPFDKRFDVLLYLFSWHFIKDFDKAFKEINRLINKNGIVIIIEPSDKTENWASKKLRKDCPEFDKKLYESKIMDINKAANKIKERKDFEIITSEFGKDNKECLYVLRKKKEN